MIKKVYLRTIILICILGFSGRTFAGKCFWVNNVNGTGIWQKNDSSNWSFSNGGTPKQCYPGANDTAYFTSSSFPTQGGSASISGLISINTIVLGSIPYYCSLNSNQSSDSVYINGTVIDSAAFVPGNFGANISGSVFFNSVKAGVTVNLNLNSWTMRNYINFNGTPTTTWNFLSDLNSQSSFSSGTPVVNFQKGNFFSNGHSFYVDSFNVKSGVHYTIASGSQIYVYDSWNADPSAKLVVSPQSTIILLHSCLLCKLKNSFSSTYFYGGGFKYGNVSFRSTSYLYGVNSFDSITINYYQDTLYLMGLADSLKFNALTVQSPYNSAILGNTTDSTVLYDMNGGRNCLSNMGMLYLKCKGKGTTHYSDYGGIVQNCSGIDSVAQMNYVSPVNISPSTCSGGYNAVVALNITGGVLPHVNSWYNQTTYTTVTAGDTLKTAQGGASYSVTISDACGDFFSGSAAIIYPANGTDTILAPALSNDTIICKGGGVPVTLSAPTATKGVAYLWSALVGTALVNKDSSVSITVSPTKTSVYKVDIKKGICVDSSTIKIIVENPKAKVGSDSLKVCEGSLFVLNADSSKGVSKGVIFPTWQNVGGLTISDSLSPILKLSSLGGTKFFLTLSDTAGICTSKDSVYVTAGDSINRIFGKATFDVGKGIINKGYLLLYKDNNSKGSWPVVDSAYLTATGSYSFDTTKISSGHYIVRVFPDSVKYPRLTPMYHLKPKFKNDTCTYYWDSATVAKVSCGGSFAWNIDIRSLPNLVDSGGNGIITGKVAKGAGYLGMKTVHRYKNQLSTQSSNDGIHGVGVGLGKKPNPSSDIIATTSTDTSGNYQFSHVPPGNYLIFADIPGLPCDSFYNVTVGAGKDSIPNNNYFVNDSVIYIQNTTGISAVQLKAVSLLSAYPNPYSGFTTLSFDLNTRSAVVLEVFNLLGEKITTLEKGVLNEGNYRYTFSAKASGCSEGIYLVKLLIDNKVYNQRIVELK